MSLLFADGFDYYESLGSDLLTGPIDRKWPIITFAGAGGPTPQAGRFGGLSLFMGDSATFTSSSFGNQQTVIVGFAYRNSIANATSVALIDFIEGTTVQCSLRINANMVLSFHNGDGGTVLATGTTDIRRDTWYYIEIKVKIDNTTGEVHVKLNGQNEIHSGGSPVTGLDTQSSLAAFTCRIRLRAGADGTQRFDDLYVLNTTTSSPGPANDDFLGDTIIETLYANGAGANTNWTPLSGANYTNIDDTVTNDSDYISSSTPGNLDTYTYTNLSVITKNIKGVQINLMHKKTTAGEKSIRSALRHSGVNYFGTTIPAYDALDEYTQIHQFNPGTSTDWTVSNVDNAEFGVELVG